MTDREELHLLTGAYALNSLDEEEKDRFEAYLLTSEEARTEVAALSDTAVALGLATTPVAPPADLRARLLAQIAVTPQLAPLTAEPARPTLTAVPDVVATDDSGPNARLASITPASFSDGAGHVASRGTGPAASRARSRWYTRPVTILVAAAAAVALFVGGNVLGLSTAHEATQQASAISKIVAASDYQRTDAKVSGGGTAAFLWSQSVGTSAVVLKDLPKLDSEKTYELWFIDSKSNATPAGTFNATGSGTTTQVLKGSLSVGDTLGITIEPSGGSKTPTTAPIVAIGTA